MDYEKKYKEALDEASVMHKAGNGDLKAVLEQVFPELKESEDESIRKDIIVLVKDWWDRVNKDNISTKEQMLAWLKKQGEHANFLNKIQIGDKVTRNEDGVLVNLSQLKRVAKPAEEYNITGIGSKNAQGKLGEMIKNLKPVSEVLEQKSAWSEEDEKEVAVLEAYICSKDWSERHIDRALGIVNELVNKVKFLRPQKQWKPSEKQIKVCKEVYADILSAKGFDLGTINGELNRLEEELKKLREK